MRAASSTTGRRRCWRYRGLNLGRSLSGCCNTGFPHPIGRTTGRSCECLKYSGWSYLLECALAMTLPGRRSYGAAVSRRCRESPSASARGALQAATRGLGTADIWASVVPLCGYLFTMGFRRIGQDHSDCDRGSPNLCETTATPITRTNPGRSGAAHRAPGHLQVSRGEIRDDRLRSPFWPDGFAQR